MKRFKPNIARYIDISGNKNLRVLRKYKKIRMIESQVICITQTPSEFKTDIIKNQLNQINSQNVEKIK